MNETQKSRFSLVASMLIFGTIGIFRRYLLLSSGMIAFVRGLVGTLFLLGVMALKKQRISWGAIRQNGLLLLLSGGLIGFNWILLFEAYNHTTIAIATLCYYMSPVFVVLASPLFLKERITAKKGLCVLVSVIGMLPVTGVLSDTVDGSDLRGVLLGLGAALLYASVVILNKRIANVPAYDKTVVQLGSAAIVMIPYLLLTEGFTGMTLQPLPILLLLVMGVLHTGVAYALYFESFEKLSAQSVALFSYLDPIAAVVLSATVLHEPMGPWEIIGAVLVLAAAILGDVTLPKKKTA
ncbi:MAG: DMT family transporter [Ruminococcaceae bacterium]|jgi:RarD protein|nr:DMT family transporter [Oscillospiraceae bacterium]